jgi:hypothetical protein
LNSSVTGSPSLMKISDLSNASRQRRGAPDPGELRRVGKAGRSGPELELPSVLARGGAGFLFDALSRLSGHNSRHSAEKTIPAGGKELLLTLTASASEVVSAESNPRRNIHSNR